MVDIRILQTTDEIIRSVNVFRQAMFGLPKAGVIDERWVADLMQPGRVYAAFDGEQIVGTANSFISTLKLPGGRDVQHAAVTHVGVSATHVRRGVMTGLLTRQLKDLHQQGVVVASLRASQGRIYQRLGYEVASQSLSIEIDKAQGGLRPQQTASQSVRLLDIEESWPVLQQIYARQSAQRAGTLSRWPQWWHFQAVKTRTSSLNHYVAVLGDAGEETAFVRYHAQSDGNWLFSQDRTVVVDDIVAARPEDFTALVRFLLSLDVTQKVSFTTRPVDDFLPLLFNNPRALTLGPVRDETWLRIVDVHAALAARRYQQGEPVVIQVVDPLLAHNNLRLEISAERVRVSENPAELTLSIDRLAQLLLGGSKAWQLQQASLIEEHNNQAVQRLDTLLAINSLPHSGIFF